MRSVETLTAKQLCKELEKRIATLTVAADRGRGNANKTQTVIALNFKNCIEEAQKIYNIKIGQIVSIVFDKNLTLEPQYQQYIVYWKQES
jgi:hypothetical protein